MSTRWARRSGGGLEGEEEAMGGPMMTREGEVRKGWGDVLAPSDVD